MPPACRPAGACGHSFCLPCLREYVVGKVTDRAYPILCVLPDCKKEVSAAECALVLTPEELETLGKVGIAGGLRGSEDWLLCLYGWIWMPALPLAMPAHWPAHPPTCLAADGG